MTPKLIAIANHAGSAQVLQSCLHKILVTVVVGTTVGVARSCRGLQRPFIHLLQIPVQLPGGTFEPKSSGLPPLEFPLKTSPALFPRSPELKESWARAAGIREAARMKFTNNKAERPVFRS